MHYFAAKEEWTRTSLCSSSGSWLVPFDWRGVIGLILALALGSEEALEEMPTLATEGSGEYSVNGGVVDVGSRSCLGARAKRGG